MEEEKIVANLDLKGVSCPINFVKTKLKTLRKWFGHCEEYWGEFKKRYLEELKKDKDLLKGLRNLCKDKTLILLYAAKDKERNNAQVLLELLKKK